MTELRAKSCAACSICDVSARSTQLPISQAATSDEANRITMLTTKVVTSLRRKRLGRNPLAPDLRCIRRRKYRIKLMDNPLYVNAKMVRKPEVECALHRP